MRNHLILYVLVLLAIFSCTGNPPKGIIPAKKMVPILVDIHLSDAINNQRYNLSMVSDSLPEDLYISICKKFKVERKEIEASLLYYGKHTKEYIPIYDAVLDVLTEMEVKAKSDTIRPARIGGFDLDTSKARKASPQPVNSDASAK